MKSIFIMTAALAILAVGCDQQREARTDRAIDSEKDSVKKSVREAKAEVDKQADAQKEILEAEAKAAQAKIDAEKARIKAESTDAQAKVDAASQTIRDAAGNAANKVGTEVGAGKSTVTAPPAEATTPPVTAPAPPAATTPTTVTPSSTEADQKLTEQVRNAVTGGGDENAGAQTIQITVSGGTATLTGTVKSDAEKAQAEQKAKAVAGVTKVENQLQVKAQ